jgi:hypothetical protein
MANYKITGQWCGAILTKIWKADNEQDAISEYLDGDWAPVVTGIEVVGDDALVGATTLTITVET